MKVHSWHRVTSADCEDRMDPGPCPTPPCNLSTPTVHLFSSCSCIFPCSWMCCNCSCVGKVVLSSPCPSFPPRQVHAPAFPPPPHPPIALSQLLPIAFVTSSAFISFHYVPVNFFNKPTALLPSPWHFPCTQVHLHPCLHPSGHTTKFARTSHILRFVVIFLLIHVSY